MMHTVQIGETINKVAFQYGIRPFDILLFNREVFSEQQYIYPGMRLYIQNGTLRQDQMDWLGLTEFNQHDLEGMLSRLQKNGVETDVIGYSVMNKPIYAFKIGTGKKKVFYSGGWHANEWITSKLLAYFLYEISERQKDQQRWHGYSIEELLKDSTLYVVPIVNPDGIELVQQGIYNEHPHFHQVLEINKGMRSFDHWSSNIRGVDLNHQWPAGWAKEANESPKEPWSRHYSGQKPLTEPEAKAIYKYTNQHQFDYVLAFHSQGQVIYWGYNHLEPEVSEAMVSRLSYVSSYLPVKTADSDGGYKDWFIQHYRKPGFTIEVGVGVNPLSPDHFSEVWSNNCLLTLEALSL
ncbi:M14 family metallopeptidase [Halalkalibacter sp. APA_J-10(15)]|uniref:M14 family metallopeptidase n=1 Tax=Halalkalibacter sp. APA_J-10(15) TaxID=2933805 RepID=UPI001FF625B4|nr:M14 family metallopeptidase [Halalkalibacter sp. APA_J-10(15)]MCK0472160.1 M14 family metallopeptidase [Halalkalibacter sp. APA_J-10(15)]